MKILLLLGSFALWGCDYNSKARIEECAQGIGEACNQLGKASEGKQAIAHFRRACDLENTNGCVNLAAALGASDLAEAKRVLKYACDRGNTNGCTKLAELLLKP